MIKIVLGLLQSLFAICILVMLFRVPPPPFNVGASFLVPTYYIFVSVGFGAMMLRGALDIKRGLMKKEA